MATTQKQASAQRRIMFRSRGGGYTSFLHASTGNFIQQYDDDGNCYPEITASDPIRLTFTATSSRQTGVVVPDSITYKIGGVTLGFDSSGNCNSPSNAVGYFKKDGADLLVTGNIATGYLNKTSSIVEALAQKNGDDLYACCPVDISEYKGGRNGKVSIAPADNKNFTLTSQTDVVKLKAGVLTKTGWSYNNVKYRYVWEVADSSEATGWRVIQVGTGTYGTLIISAEDVNTYANIKCTVLLVLGNTTSTSTPPSSFSWATILKGNIVGSDCVGILDASDPLDIICTVKINKTGTGTEVDADDESLDDTMPDNAYLIYMPTLVMRGGTASAGTTTWLNGMVCDPSGAHTRNIVPSGGKYKVTVADVKSSYGEHTFIMNGKLS